MFDFIFRNKIKNANKNIFEELNEYSDFKDMNGKVLGIHIDDESVETVRKFKESPKKIKVSKCITIGARDGGIFDLYLYTNFGRLIVVYEEGGLNTYLNKGLFIWSVKLQNSYLCDEINDHLDSYSILYNDYLRLQYINRVCRMNTHEFNVVCDSAAMFDIV